MTGAAQGRRRSALPVLIAAGSVELGLLIALGWWDGATFPWMASFLFVGAFVAYGLAATRILDAAGGHITIWIFALLMRAALFPLTPELSDDIYRYLWDGEVQLAGINPYRHAPVDLEVAEIVTPHMGEIADPELHTVYPPLTQIAFFLIAAAGGAIFQAKLLWLGLDLGVAWLLGRISVITGRSRRLTQLLYLWSPLLLVEVAWNANLAPIGLFMLALVILLARAPAGAGAATGLASVTALVPALAVPAITHRLGMQFLVGFVFAVAIIAAPYVLAGEALLDSLTNLANRPEFMSGPYALFEAVLPGTMAPRVAVGLLVLAVVVWTTVHRYRPERALFWILGACVLLTPSMRPAYLLWMLPFAALRANLTWLLMTGLVFLSYAGNVPAGSLGDPSEPLWARVVIWLPFLVFLAVDGARLWEERVPPPKALSEPVG